MLIDSLQSIDFAPKSEAEEIIQNVKTILSTYCGSVVLDREFGVSATIVDTPTNEAKARVVNEYILALKKYEPRVEVTRIDFVSDHDGRVTPRVEVKIIET